MELVTLEALKAAVRERAADAPLDRVEVAISVGEDLNTCGDELIGHFVEEARGAGLSWTDIGARMGVSKQAARQRFAQPSAATTVTVPQGGLKPGDRLLACLNAAGRAAAADGAAEIGTHHLLIGLFEEGVAAAILEKLGARAEAVRTAANELFPGSGQLTPVPVPTPQRSTEARDAIRIAESLARRGGYAHVGTEHLLCALALDPGSRARRVLLRMRISIPAIKKELECYISPDGQRRRRRGKGAGRVCSFCGKDGSSGLQLIAGPGVYICAECVGLCTEIIAEHAAGAPGENGS